VAVVPGETPEAIRRLQANELDLSICLKPHDVSGLDCHPIFSDELTLLVSAHHRWVKHRPKWQEVAGETFIVSSRQSYTFQLIAEYFLKQGIRLMAVVELGSNEAIKELVKLGLGVGLCAGWTARAEIDSGELRVLPLPGGRLRRDWVVARLKRRPLNLAERTFLGLCEEVGRRLAA
jgi:LysR family transcriptional regulator, low CO2-responsive transcriptional regulator